MSKTPPKPKKIQTRVIRPDPKVLNRSPYPDLESRAWDACAHPGTKVLVDPVTVLHLIREVEAGRRRQWFLEHYELERAYETACQVASAKEDSRWKQLPK